jgi:hypothetical protein
MALRHPASHKRGVTTKFLRNSVWSDAGLPTGPATKPASIVSRKRTEPIIKQEAEHQSAFPDGAEQVRRKKERNSYRVDYVNVPLVRSLVYRYIHRVRCVVEEVTLVSRFVGFSAKEKQGLRCLLTFWDRAGIGLEYFLCISESTCDVLSCQCCKNSHKGIAIRH